MNKVRVFLFGDTVSKIDWEEKTKEVLQNREPIQAILNEWGNKDWHYEFWFSNYPPKFYIQFAKTTVSNRAFLAPFETKKGVIEVKAKLSDEDVDELCEVITPIQKISGLRIYQSRKDSVITYTLKFTF